MQTGEPVPLTPTTLSKAIGVSMPYASQILSGKRPPQVPMAIRIFRATGHKLGPIKDSADTEIAALEKHLAALDRFQGAA